MKSSYKKLSIFVFLFSMMFLSMGFVSSAPNVVFSPGDEDIELGTFKEWDFGTYFSGSAGAFNMFGSDQVDSISFQIGDSYSSNTYSPSGGEYTAEARNQAGGGQWQITAASQTPSAYNGPYEINNVVLEACSGTCNSTDPFNVDIVAPDPDQIATPSTISMNYNEVKTRDYSAIFDSNTYTAENAFFSDPVDSSSVSIGDDYASNSYSPSGGEYTVTVTAGGQLEVDSEQTDVSINDMKMEVCNDYGNCEITNGFSTDITGSSGGGGTNASGLNDFIVSYYPLNETSGNVVDVAGSNPGTNNGATRGVTGKINNSFDFDGSDDYATLPAQNDLSQTGAVTFSLWVNGQVSSSGPDGEVDYMGSFSSSKNGFIIRTVNNGANFQFYDGNNGVITAGNPQADVWQHIVVTRDSNGNVEMFIDGSSIGTGSTSSSFYDEDISLARRGSFLGSSDARHFEGKIHEVGIWNRALNSSEVSDLYNNDSGLSYGNFTTQTNTTSNQTKPSVLANPINNTITFNDQVNYNYDNFFNNYSTVNAYFQDKGDSVSVTIGDNWTSKNYSSSNGDYNVNVNNDIFTVNSGTTNTKLEGIKLESCNSVGCSTTNEFNISISGQNVSKPQVLSSVADISMKYNETRTISNIPSFFSNATSYDISFSDPIDSQSTVVGNGTFSQSSYSPSGNNYTISYSNGDITINSEETDVNISDAELVGCNSVGCNRTNEFSILISEDGQAGNGDDGDGAENFLEWITGAVTGLFPDSEDVSNIEGFVYFFLFALLISGITLYVSGASAIGQTLSMIFTGLTFIFFTLIGYISIIYLIIAILVLILIIYLQSRR